MKPALLLLAVAFVFWPWALVMLDLGCWIVTSEACTAIGWTQGMGEKMMGAMAWSAIAAMIVLGLCALEDL